MNLSVIPLLGFEVGALEIEAGKYGSHHCPPADVRRPSLLFLRRNYAVVQPPLGLITWPIMNFESSDAR